MPVAKTVVSKSFLEPGDTVGVSTRNGFELGTLVYVSESRIEYTIGDKLKAVPWAHITAVESM